jgi:hypothetical protein
MCFLICYSRFIIENLLRAAAWAADIDFVESALSRCQSLNMRLDNDGKLLQVAVEGSSIEI